MGDKCQSIEYWEGNGTCRSCAEVETAETIVQYDSTEDAGYPPRVLAKGICSTTIKSWIFVYEVYN